jgi:predicted ATPase
LSEELDRRHQLICAIGPGDVGRKRLSYYRFRHFLFQKYLYSRLDANEQVYLHEDVGNALEALRGEQKEELAVQLARHFAEAHVMEKALHYLVVAGDRARQLGAGEEASEHFTQAIALLQTLPASSERDQHEMTLQFALALTQLQWRGPAAAEVLLTLERARQLAEQGHDPLSTFAALWALYNWHLTRCNLNAARQLAEQLRLLIEPIQVPALLMETHLAFTNVYMFTGQAAAAQQHREQMARFYQLGERQILIQLYGFDPIALDRSYECIFLCYLGHPDQALRIANEILQAAIEQGHPYPHAVALFTLVGVHSLRGEWKAVLEWAEECIAVSAKYGMAYWLGWAHVLSGHARALQGQAGAGIAQLLQGMEMHQEISVRLHRATQLQLLAEAYLANGQLDDGLSAIEESLSEATATGETWWLANLYRLKGDLLLAQSVSNQADAAAWFERAIAKAQKQRARYFELRATIPLVRLLQRKNWNAEAYTMLYTIYNWFTEGLDTPELVQARILLTSLSGPPVADS